MAALHTQVTGATYVARSHDAFGDIVTAWLNTERARWKVTTWATAEQLARTHIAPALGHVKVQDITSLLLNAFYAEKLTSGRRNGKGGLSSRTVHYLHTLVHGALDYAQANNLVSLNAATAARPPSNVTAKPMMVWTAEQLRAFLAHAKDDIHYPLWLLAASTGLRRGELAGVRWGDIHDGRLHVEQSVVVIRGVPTFSTPKSKASRRSISLDSVTMAVLQAHRKRQVEARLASGAGYVDHDLVFAAQDGGPLHPESITDLFQAAAKSAGLPVIRLHDVRHSYASIALQQGVNPVVVQQRLGHGNIRVTLGTYSHVLPGVAEAEAERVAAAILGTG